MSEFYEGYAEILEIPQSTISPKFDLTEHNWDSLAIISSTALIDDCFGVVLTGTALGRVPDSRGPVFSSQNSPSGMMSACSETKPDPGFVVAGLSVRGVVCALPARCVDNDAFTEQFGAVAVAEVTKVTGVKTRYWADEQKTAGDLCLAASRQLLERLDWLPSSVDALVFVTQTPDHRVPATACQLHGKLGLPARCVAFDVNLGCSGYVYGLWLAAGMMAAGCRRILFLAGDTSSRTMDPTDRGTVLLFGDAGSATALEYAPDAKPAYFSLGTDGASADHLIIASGGFRRGEQAAARRGIAADKLFMDGGEVFTFVLRAVPALIRATLANAGRAVEEIDSFLLHQANRFALRHVAKKLEIQTDRMPVNIDRYGNTSSASIPLLMCTDLAARVTEAPATLLLAGFGVGFSWGAACMTMGPLTCAEVVTA